jgi:hypothetical protein
MSSLWTPGGEHRVPPADAGTEPGGHRGVGRADPLDGADGLDDALDDAELAAAAEELQAELAAARQRVAELPAAQIVANHAMGLFELAAIHLSSEPPRPSEARLAIDALAALVDGVGDRLGEATPTLRDALHHLRLRYVQVQPPPATS